MLPRKLPKRRGKKTASYLVVKLQCLVEVLFCSRVFSLLQLEARQSDVVGSCGTTDSCDQFMGQGSLCELLLKGWGGRRIKLHMKFLF